MHAVGLSDGKPDVPMVATDSPVAPRNLSKSNPNLTKSCPIFTRFCIDYFDPIPKLFPKDQLKMITGLAGISDHVKGKLWARKEVNSSQTCSWQTCWFEMHLGMISTFLQVQNIGKRKDSPMANANTQKPRIEPKNQIRKGGRERAAHKHSNF